MKKVRRPRLLCRCDDYECRKCGEEWDMSEMDYCEETHTLDCPDCGEQIIEDFFDEEDEIATLAATLKRQKELDEREKVNKKA